MWAIFAAKLMSSCHDAEPLIELRNVRKAFGNQVVLDGVDLSIYPGEAIGILGPSGTGKSTILRIISGLILPDSGEVWVAGQQRTAPITEQPNPFPINLVFQQAALFDSLTVGENVGFYLYQHTNLTPAEIERYVAHSLDSVGLPNIAHLMPSELSGGMRKRVSFARAIISTFLEETGGRSLILYDEPTAGLDPIASTVVEDLMRSLKEQQPQAAYVVVTHQESTTRRTADRLILLYRGRVCWQGSAAALDETDNIYVRQFLSGRIDGPIQVAT
nr:ABC transporter ATP-binding protein [Synechococcus elongatus PCC 11801]